MAVPNHGNLITAMEFLQPCWREGGKAPATKRLSGVARKVASQGSLSYDVYANCPLQDSLVH